jgi:hypothetical protein
MVYVDIVVLLYKRCKFFFSTLGFTTDDHKGREQNEVN